MKRTNGFGPWPDLPDDEGVLFAAVGRDLVGLERLARDLDELARIPPGVGRVTNRLRPADSRPRQRGGHAGLRRFLVIGDDRGLVRGLTTRLHLSGLQAEVSAPEHVLSVVEDDAPDALVLDLDLVRGNARELLDGLALLHPHLPVITLGDGGAEARGVAHAAKPVDIDALASWIEAAFRVDDAPGPTESEDS